MGKQIDGIWFRDYIEGGVFKQSSRCFIPKNKWGSDVIYYVIYQCGWVVEVVQKLEQDVFLSCLKKDVEGGNGEILHFSVAGGRLLYKNRVVIPKHSISVTKLLQEYQDSLVGGHSGELKTYLRIGEKMWPNMFKNAASARETKGSNQSPAGLLQSSTYSITGSSVGSNHDGFYRGPTSFTRIWHGLSGGLSSNEICSFHQT